MTRARLFLVAFFLLLFQIEASAKTLNVRLLDSPVTLDWNGPATLLEAPLILNLCEGLFSYDYPSGKLVPGIAESLSKSKDSTEYTFKIRRDAKWSDGRAILAQDFIDAWLKLISPQSSSIYIYYLFDVMNAKEYNAKSIQNASDVGFKALDDHTIFVKLKRASPNWEANTAFWPLFPNRKDLIEKFGTNWWRAGVLVSSGPFVFDSYEPGKMAVLKRNPEYKRYHSNIDEIDFYILSNRDEALAKYESKFFDFLWGMPFSILNKYKSRSDYHIQNIMRGHVFGINTAKFPMNNRDFRKAILQSLNPSKLIPPNSDQLHLVKTLIPPPLKGSKKPAILAYDPKAARLSLKKSGIVLDKKFKIRLLTNLSEPFNSIGKLIQAQIIDTLGINVELFAPQSQEYTAYMELGDYNATLISWTAKVLSPQDFLLPYSGDATYNRMHFTSSFYDQWIFEGVRSVSTKDAENAFYQAEKVISVDEAVLSPLFYETNASLVRQNIKHLYFNHMGIPILKDVEVVESTHPKPH